MFLDEKKTGEAETKPQVPSLRGLVAWLETQDPTTEYDWACTNGGCLMGLYATSVGICYKDMCTWPQDGGRPYYERCNNNGGGGPYSGIIAISKPRTFGAALERARSCL